MTSRINFSDGDVPLLQLPRRSRKSRSTKARKKMVIVPVIDDSDFDETRTSPQGTRSSSIFKLLRNPLKLIRYTIFILGGFFVMYFLISSLAISFKFDLRLTTFNYNNEDASFFTKEFAIVAHRSEITKFEEEEEEDSYREVDLIQHLTPTANKKKITIAQEKSFACKEVSCVEKCSNKIKPLCLKSDTCRKRKLRECKLNCRKQRCADRCEIEPQLGYVEREMKLDACKDECKGSERCSLKCDKTFMPCKTKCRSITAKKFSCDVVQEIPVVKKDAVQTGTEQEPEAFDFEKEISMEIQSEEI